MVPRIPIGTPTQKMAFQCHSERKPPINSPRKRARDGGHHVDPKRHAALVGGERVGQDRRRRRHQHRAAHALNHAPADQPQRPAAHMEGVKRQRDGRKREDGEPEVVGADTAEHVTEAAERHDQHRGHHQVAHQHPQQIADVARRQRIQADASEDRRQRDQDDRRVDRRQQRPQGGVGQDDPLVGRVVVIHAPPTAGSLGQRRIDISHNRGFRHLNLSRHPLHLRIYGAATGAKHIY